MENKYMCCFCENQIESNEIDITSLIIISNWDKAQETQQEQQLFCHVNCLKKKIGAKVPLYLTDVVD